MMFSTDRNIFSQGSSVAARMVDYGALVEELHIVVLSDTSHGLKKVELAKNVWAYPTNSLMRFSRPISAARMGKKIIKEQGFVRGRAVITAQDPFECGWAAMKVKKRWRLPLEVQLHTDPFSPYFTGFLNLIRKKFARRVLEKADSIRVVSESLKLAARSYKLEAPISVLPIYIDKDKIEKGRITFDLHARYGWKFVILAVARLTPEKNLTQAIEVLHRVKQFYPGAGLVIVGSGPEENRLRDYANRLDLKGAVIFAGWQEDTASYYGTSNLFIQASHFEGYGLALVEAGLSGLPVVTTPVGIAQDLVSGKEAVICPHGDVEFMFKAVYDLVENHDLREELSVNLKQKLNQILMNKEEYLNKLKADWDRAATLIS